MYERPNTAYAVNDTVTYSGSTYTCRQAHTSL
ncbi:carbohydrate-binding protein, partial [Paenibacillus sp. F4]